MVVESEVAFILGFPKRELFNDYSLAFYWSWLQIYKTYVAFSFLVNHNNEWVRSISFIVFDITNWLNALDSAFFGFGFLGHYLWVSLRWVLLQFRTGLTNHRLLHFSNRNLVFSHIQFIRTFKMFCFISHNVLVHVACQALHRHDIMYNVGGSFLRSLLCWSLARTVDNNFVQFP